MLGALGGALGLLLAVWGSRALLRVAAGGGPDTVPLDVAIDWRVMTFTGVVTGLTAVLFGMVPALRATRVELAAQRYARTVAGSPADCSARPAALGSESCSWSARSRCR